MQALFLDQLSAVRDHKSPHEAFNHSIALIRAILQHAAIGAYEQHDQVSQLDPQEEVTILSALRNPTDSAPVDVLNRLIPHLRARTKSLYCQGWFEKLSRSRTEQRPPLAESLKRWVALRNKTHHTIIDLATIEKTLPELISYADTSLHVLNDALPSTSDNGRLVHTIGSLSFPSRTLKLDGGQPVVIRRIRSRRGVWLAETRTLNIRNSVDGQYELHDSPLSGGVEASSDAFVTYRIPTERQDGSIRPWITEVHMPNRQTHRFMGRTEQIEELMDWYNDDTSRMCLVYGDGGIGKTTLVLEWLHGILENPPPDLKWYPDLICFYTAKLTRWSAEG